ncbi:uncharacterized protein LOC126976728 [Leptidea sinapis]|uniref:uncharacterized protein LOC126976728 n=1 Tax=Leptidea sinapis TaxID=189913 RepID=UPI0021C34CA5|nr:uncharacterized protein LOC126976728 [Leptidea sinapis]
MSDIRQQFVNFNAQMERLLTSVDGLTKRVECIENKVSVLENKYASNDVTGLVDTVERLKFDLNDREQELLLTDVEITGLSEANGENPMHLVCLVSKKLGVELEERDIVSAVRVGPKRGMTEGAAPVKPRPLAVRLSRRAQRDNMLRAARVRRGVNTEGFELPGPTDRFYVNKRLTKTNRQLFYDTRQAGTKGWKYVWTRDGRIYARKKNDTEARRIRCEADIKKYFFGALKVK